MLKRKRTEDSEASPCVKKRRICYKDQSKNEKNEESNLKLNQYITSSPKPKKNEK